MLFTHLPYKQTWWQLAVSFNHSISFFLLLLLIQVQTTTTLGNLRGARAPGSARSRCSHRTCGGRAARRCESPTANSSGCSCSRACSASEYLPRDPPAARGADWKKFCAVHHNLALFKGKKAEKLQLKTYTVCCAFGMVTVFVLNAYKKLESQYLFREQIT